MASHVFITMCDMAAVDILPGAKRYDMMIWSQENVV